MAQRISEKTTGETNSDTEESLLEGHVHTYFHRTSPMFKGMEKINTKHDSFKLPPAAKNGSGETFNNDKPPANTEDIIASADQSSQEQSIHEQSPSKRTSETPISNEKTSHGRE